MNPEMETVNPAPPVEHVCLHEADFVSMNMNITKMCKQMDDVHQEIMGPPGQPGLKAKVASQQKQLTGVFAVLGIIGAALMTGLVKIFFFAH